MNGALIYSHRAVYLLKYYSITVKILMSKTYNIFRIRKSKSITINVDFKNLFLFFPRFFFSFARRVVVH